MSFGATKVNLPNHWEHQGISFSLGINRVSLTSVFLFLFLRMEDWSQQHQTTLFRYIRFLKELLMASSLVSPWTQTMSSLTMTVPKLLLDLGNLCLIRKKIAIIQGPSTSSHGDFANEIFNPHTAEGFKIMQNAFQERWWRGKEWKGLLGKNSLRDIWSTE